jgi:hypothetical protein
MAVVDILHERLTQSDVGRDGSIEIIGTILGEEKSHRIGEKARELENFLGEVKVGSRSPAKSVGGKKEGAEHEKDEHKFPGIFFYLRLGTA